MMTSRIESKAGPSKKLQSGSVSKPNVQNLQMKKRESVALATVNKTLSNGPGRHKSEPKSVTTNLKDRAPFGSNTNKKSVAGVSKASVPRSAQTPKSKAEASVKKKNDPAPVLSSLLDLPDELLLLIVQEIARNGTVTIRVPELFTRRSVSSIPGGSANKQAPIYHLSLTSRRLRNICSEFMFQGIEFLFRCSGRIILSRDIEHLSRTFQRHVKDHSSIRRASFSTRPETGFVDNARLLRPFILNVIQKCQNLQRITLPNFFTLDQWQDDLELLQAVNDHPSPNLSIVYPKINSWNTIFVGTASSVYSKVSFSRVVLRSLDVSHQNEAAARSYEILLGRGLRIQRLDRSYWYSERWPWSHMTYAGLQTVTGWFPSWRPIERFLNAHPLLGRFGIYVGEEGSRDFSKDEISWLATNIPGIRELFDNFHNLQQTTSTYIWKLTHLTLVRPNRIGVWKLEEVHVCYRQRQLDDILAVAKHLRSLLPVQVQRVLIDKSLEMTETDMACITSALAKRGLKVRWLN
ncbi:hypothetical protein K435DRAFT_962395 [Dendrothele bispora CBS 962.96]|uniref:F-box domain-containing protein n=1 Tax=Dendrothele bispora (strain CBS 962.96) TaxID=1314807 RepID=A0A4S8MKX8_DENBC|nr:hypothetical protein K435DRAFT_962395 [Dendrothele bispora CBS 962.96]